MLYATLDLSGPHRAVFTNALPDATLVADPFHVVKLASTKLDECRRRAQNELLGHLGRKRPALPGAVPTHQSRRAPKVVKAFALDYEANYPKAVAKVTDDLDVLLEFVNCPNERWVHLRTTNPIESTFAALRLRTRVT